MAAWRRPICRRSRRRARISGDFPGSSSTSSRSTRSRAGLHPCPPERLQTSRRHGFKLPAGASLQQLFPGPHHRDAAAAAGRPGDYDDGAPADLAQYTKDVAAFLMWAAEPKLDQRHRVGFQVIIFLIVLAGLLYFTKKKVWHEVEAPRETAEARIRRRRDLAFRSETHVKGPAAGPIEAMPCLVPGIHVSRTCCEDERWSGSTGRPGRAHDQIRARNHWRLRGVRFPGVEQCARGAHPKSWGASVRTIADRRGGGPAGRFFSRHEKATGYRRRTSTIGRTSTFSSARA